ncbi:MAG TPA: hypothetical protein VG095_08405, partial [Chthoniobacterales bacterium]|nr:hypothetical protein [Chthoniobacterales bacterium]
VKRPQKNWLEWTVFALSAVLILTVIGFLIYESAMIGQKPPDIHLRMGEVQARDGYFALPLEVTNTGDQTAEGVHLEVVLKTNGGEERADLEIQFLPRRGKREAWVNFKTDPRTGTLDARVLGYEKP